MCYHGVPSCTARHNENNISGAPGYMDHTIHNETLIQLPSPTVSHLCRYSGPLMDIVFNIIPGPSMGCKGLCMFRAHNHKELPRDVAVVTAGGGSCMDYGVKEVLGPLATVVIHVMGCLNPQEGHCTIIP